jgi:hypothetical protein
MQPGDLKQNVTVHGPLFPEPVQIILAIPMGSSVKLIGKGVRSGKVYEPILSIEQLGQLHASPVQEPFDGDATKFRLGVEAMRLGLAYEYDPYFSLSIARVDPCRLTALKTRPSATFAAIVHLSTAFFTQIGMGTVRMCPPFPTRSTIAQWP